MIVWNLCIAKVANNGNFQMQGLWQPTSISERDILTLPHPTCSPYSVLFIFTTIVTNSFNFRSVANSQYLVIYIFAIHFVPFVHQDTFSNH